MHAAPYQVYIFLSGVVATFQPHPFPSLTGELAVFHAVARGWGAGARYLLGIMISSDCMDGYLSFINLLPKWFLL